MDQHQPGNVRILAVDDDQHVLDLYEEFLSSKTSTYHFDLTLCRRSDEAVEAVRLAIEEKKPFAVTFLDIRMSSGQDGVWAAEQIRTLDPNIEIVMVTAYDDLSPEEIVSRVPPAGKLLYLRKPFSPEEIKQFADALSAKWQQEVQLHKIHSQLETRVSERTAELIEINEQLKREIEDRKQAEEKLRESEQLYRNLFENVPLGLGIADERGNIIAYNEAILQPGGYTHEDIARIKNVGELYHIPEKRDETLAIAQERGFVDQVEVQFRRKDGTPYDALLTLRPVQVGGQQCWLAMVEDITERKRAVELVVKSEERYRLVVEDMPAMVCRFLPDGTLTFVNNAYCLYFEKKREDLIGQNFFQFIPLEDQEKVRNHFTSLNQDQPMITYEHQVIAPDGTIRWQLWTDRALFDEQARLVEYQSIGSDITEHKQAEEALRQSEEKYRTALEANPDPVVVYDMEGKVVYFNPAFTRIFGWPLGECLGKKMDVFVPEKNWPETKMMIDRVLAGESFSGIESRRYTKKGNIIPVSISGAVLREMDGNPVGSVINLRDISEQKNLERQLQQAQKMEAVGTLAGGIAHDFNNLLQAIQGYTELLLMRKKEGERGWRELREVIRAAKRGGELTQQLLTFSRKVESKRRPLDLNQEVGELRELLERTIPKMIEVKFRLADDLKVINADSVQLEQVLMNLAVNAKDAMAEGGQLNIETQNLTLDQEFCRKYAEVRPGDYVMLSISDTGHGMDKETLEHIFDPFYTTKEVGKGTGLGLAIVYGIIKNHEGYIMCSSRPGKGTTFKIYLPVIEPEVDFMDIVESQEPIVLAKGGNETILLVDDEEFIRELGQDLLGGAGYKVLTAADGESALQIYRREQGQIDLVILDLIMPGMGGSKCLEELLKLDPKAQVLIASGHSPDAFTKGTLETGARGFVSKPYDTSQLLKLVRDILDQD